MGISVAMCTYNGESYLQEQLDSIARQVRLPDELVICDDGSTDGTVELVRRFIRTVSFATRLICNPVNLGYSRNFANAVTLCSKDIIAFSDQDDVWYPDKLSRIERHFNLQVDVDGIFSNGDLIDSHSQPTGRSLWDSFLFSPESQAEFNGNGSVGILLQRNVVTGMAFAFRSRVKSHLDTMPPSWIHDGWLAFMIAARSKLFADPEVLVGYRLHSTQQIGAPGSAADKLRWIRDNGVGAYLRRLRQRNLEEYERTAIQFAELAEYLRREARPDERALIAAVEAKVAHARVGAAALKSSRLRRWTMVAPHLDGYETFSPNGLRTLTRDLLV